MSLQLINCHLDAWLNQHLDSGTGARLYVVPGIHHENYLEKRFLESSATNCVPGGKALRLEDFVFRSLYARNHNPKPVNNHLKREAIRMALLLAQKNNELAHFNSIFSKDGLIDQFSESITQLKQALVRPEDLLMIHENEKDTFLKNKLNDLIVIFGYYQGFLEGKSLYDMEDCYSLLISLLKDEHEESDESLVLTGFNTLTGLDIEIIKTLKKNMAVTLLYKGKPQYLTSFEEYTDEPAPEIDLSQNAKVISAFGKLEEVKEIAYFLLNKKKESFSDFTIVLKNKAKYLPIIKRVFENYNIPLDCQANKPLKNYPIATRLNTVLKKTVYGCEKNSNLDITESFKKNVENEGIAKGLSLNLSGNFREEGLLALKAYNKFLEAVQTCEDVIKQSGFPFNYKYFYNVFKHIVKNSTVEESITQGSGVKILDYRYSESVNTKYIIVTEMLDGVFPTTAKLNAVLDSQTTFLLRETHGYQIPSEDEQENTERNIFLALASLPDKKFLFTHPKGTGDGNPTLPSPLIVSVTDRVGKTFYDSNRIDESLLNKEVNEKCANQIKLKHTPNSFSPTSIEQFALCPYKFLMEKILRIRKKSENELDIDASKKGDILHKALELFYRDEDGYNLIKSDPVKAKTVALALFEKVFSEEVDKLTDYKKLLKPHLKRKLKQYIDTESTDPTPLKPSLFEKELIAEIKTFEDGKLEINQAMDNITLEPDKMYLKAIIDRVDLDEKSKAFGVVDYKFKSPKLRGVSDIKSGKKFQLPFYLYLFSSHEDYKDYSPKYAFYHKLFQKERCHGVFIDENEDRFAALNSQAEKGNLISKESLSSLLDEAKINIAKVISQIREAKFEVTPSKDSGCEYCDYGDICRKTK
jgi:ATP-dependent helicase/DNAse subunit B